jgi:hypothetical protein
MPKDTGEIVVGANGTLYVADFGTEAPANIEAAWGAGWVDLGYLSEDGVTLTDGKTIEDIMVWQLFYAARKIVTERTFTAAFVLRQFNGVQVELAFGGGEVAVNGSGFRFTPPDPETVDERALGIEWLDGDKTFRLVIPKGIVTENVETKIVRNAAADLPITIGVIGQADEDPWYFDTDDPTFAEAT